MRPSDSLPNTRTQEKKTLKQSNIYTRQNCTKTFKNTIHRVYECNLSLVMPLQDKKKKKCTS